MIKKISLKQKYSKYHLQYRNTCFFCKEEFHPIRRKQKYCSRFCAVRGRFGITKRSEIKNNTFCTQCKKSIYRKNFLLKKNKNNFCSYKCHFLYKKKSTVLKNNPNWKNGKSFEKYPVDWNLDLKNIIRKRDKNRCQLCNKKQVNLCVHHIDYNKLNCDLNNLISLCRVCHGRTTAHRKNWQIIFRNIIFKYGKIKFITNS